MSKMMAAVDSVSSVAGVKDLFDDCEETLLPVKTQLLRYKSRDLASSHQVRTRCKIFGPRKLVRKTVIGPSDGNQDLDFSDIEFPRYYKSLGNDADIQQTVASSSENEDPAADVPFHQWLEDRKKLRNDLNNIGLESDWLKRKPVKSALEERVLQRLKNQDAEKKENAGKSVKNVRFDAAKRKDELKSKRLNEFRRVSSACQKTGLQIDDNLLKDVLLHPGDIPPEQWNTRARQPPNNLSENFWKYRSKKRHRRRQTTSIARERMNSILTSFRRTSAAVKAFRGDEFSRNAFFEFQ